MALIDRIGGLFANWRRPVAAVGFVIKTAARSLVTDSPTITSGAGSPTSQEPDGSIYHQTDDFPRYRFGGGWVPGITPADVQVAHVNGRRTDSYSADGSPARPYQSIQAALNEIPTGTTDATARTVHLILVAPGDYDEDLTIIVHRKRIAIVGLGPFNIGLFDAAEWQPSGTPRNITVLGDQANVDGIRSSLHIGTMMNECEGLTTHESYVSRVRLSGKMDFSGAAAIGSIETCLSMEIYDDGATGNSISAGNATLQLYCYRSRFRAGIVGSNVQVQVAERCRFQGLVDVGGTSFVFACRVDAGWKVLTMPAGIRPHGFVNTEWTGGDFTRASGGAANFVTDAYTNFFFNLSSASLLDGGSGVPTKTLLHDLT